MISTYCHLDGVETLFDTPWVRMFAQCVNSGGKTHLNSSSILPQDGIVG